MSDYQLLCPQLDLTNIATVGVAEQSSHSPWSSELGANGVLCRDCPENFGFHTDEEDAPWWMVDLHRPYPLDALVLHNRRDGFTDKAKTITVKTSLDKITWTTIHSGISYFGPGNGAPPLQLSLRGQLWARYVRLELSERNYFHLAQVEIFVETKFVRIVELGNEWCVSLPMVNEPNSVYPESYEIVGSKRGAVSDKVIGLKINQNGAFGNCVIQYANAIELARKAGLHYIQVANGGLIKLEEKLPVDGLTFLPAEEPRPQDGAFLKGYFFHIQPAATRTSEDYHAIIKDVAKKLFPSIVPNKKVSDELCIHIRSGDIFSSWVHADYVQPPLSFYKLLIEKLNGEGVISKVKLVFEDRRNPVVDPLEAYLRDRSIDYTCQSGTVVDDINTIVNAKYMAYGYGTFGQAICHFSDSIDTVFNFVPEGGQLFPQLPNIRRTINIIDQSKEYIKVGEWRNTDDQRNMMVAHSMDKLCEA
ncbi:discoidin domain-containing protein [Rhizobium sp. Root483D2]|uniref:discoidin domain-containing protein n=1 Tax=Rhizobium sp. Root483D2 TaxID=1736545 RepID=UPI000AC3C227|nr:discoidin domain-containing protein [Rhizobium sp. Root483D2]